MGYFSVGRIQHHHFFSPMLRSSCILHPYSRLVKRFQSIWPFADVIRFLPRLLVLLRLQMPHQPVLRLMFRIPLLMLLQRHHRHHLHLEVKRLHPMYLLGAQDLYSQLLVLTAPRLLRARTWRILQLP